MRNARLHLPYDQWPKADQHLWEHQAECKDPFSDSFKGRRSNRTKRAYNYAWRRFLHFIMSEDPAALSLKPAERLSKERLKRYVLHLKKTNRPSSIAIQFCHLYGCARWLLPEEDLTWLKEIKAWLFRSAPPRASRPAVTSLQFAKLGIELMEEFAPNGMLMTRRDALYYRDGLILAFLAFIPLRRANLASLEIGKHLRVEAGQRMVSIPASESKTGVSFHYPVPSRIDPYLEIYIQTVRPVLLKSDSLSSLWISHRGTTLCENAFNLLVEKHSIERLGVRLSPHDARSAACTLWAIELPSQITVARDLLGHAHLQTTELYYNRAKGIQASRAQAEQIERLKRL